MTRPISPGIRPQSTEDTSAPKREGNESFLVAPAAESEPEIAVGIVFATIGVATAAIGSSSLFLAESPLSSTREKTATALAIGGASFGIAATAGLASFRAFRGGEDFLNDGLLASALVTAALGASVSGIGLLIMPDDGTGEILKKSLGTATLALGVGGLIFFAYKLSSEPEKPLAANDGIRLKNLSLGPQEISLAFEF